MTQMILVSDNHMEQGILYEVMKQFPECNVAIHLGDSQFTYDDIELSQFVRVKGNTDFYPEFPAEEIVNVNGVRAFCAHGHVHEVNRTRDILVNQAKMHRCQFAFYGHTHVAKHEEIEGIHVINPGSISQSRSRIEETYAEINVDDKIGKVYLKFRNRNHDVISEEVFQL
ncbi:metallophosphoesterase [Staphylococcus sp. SQ8-PEA]|uniref:Phosphoesterase n=1 Tax=Staphylococcus marylandisciuri TaxID=2981529 RepID=A0ABT2QP07_9STAP|nr:metallophosphoesterase [Staphylococcus marylandisciuri]MCU5745711.1 metallophosphoesterase [Staphylococcus marylandisciuri]